MANPGGNDDSEQATTNPQYLTSHRSVAAMTIEEPRVALNTLIGEATPVCFKSPKLSHSQQNWGATIKDEEQIWDIKDQINPPVPTSYFVVDSFVVAAPDQLICTEHLLGMTHAQDNEFLMTQTIPSWNLVFKLFEWSQPSIQSGLPKGHVKKGLVRIEACFLMGATHEIDPVPQERIGILAIGPWTPSEKPARDTGEFRRQLSSSSPGSKLLQVWRFQFRSVHFALKWTPQFQHVCGVLPFDVVVLFVFCLRTFLLMLLPMTNFILPTHIHVCCCCWMFCIDMARAPFKVPCWLHATWSDPRRRCHHLSMVPTICRVKMGINDVIFAGSPVLHHWSHHYDHAGTQFDHTFQVIWLLMVIFKHPWWRQMKIIKVAHCGWWSLMIGITTDVRV